MQEFLLQQGFAPDMIEECVYDEDPCLEACAELYAGHIQLLREDFDDWFILRMFSMYLSVFMRTDLPDMLDTLCRELDTELWASMIQYDFSTNGDSQAFALMDSMKVGYFAENAAQVCRRIRRQWTEDFGEET